MENIANTIASNLGRLKSHDDSRQKKLCRDLFIKTNSLNGNSNGDQGCVLAMRNEYYRELRSSLSTNANLEYFKGSALSKKCYATSICKQKTQENYDSKNSVKCVNNSISTPEIAGEGKTSGKKEVKDQENFLDCLKNNSIQINSSFANDPKASCHKEITKTELFAKITILNKVLQNPWKPQLPYNFRPLPRRSYDFLEAAETLSSKYEENIVINEDNTGTVGTSIVTMTKEIEESAKYKNTNTYECQQIFTDKATFEFHKKKHTSRYTCIDCGKSFSQLRNFNYHMSKHRGTKEFATNCPICDKYFNDKGYLSSHMKIHRNRKEYQCNFCLKSFNQRVAYNMHLRIHTGVKPHVCNECGKAFSRKMLLKQHQRTHSGEKPYPCSYCDKRFADRSNMTLHMKLHTGVKPFICTFCSKSFTKKHHLKSHLNVHTGDKPYSCPRCKLAFTQSSNMRTHYKKCNK